ncbi:hypothetical protein JCM10207_006791 [Rhodosporidiobolus poonsookiae]
MAEQPTDTPTGLSSFTSMLPGDAQPARSTSPSPSPPEVASSSLAANALPDGSARTTILTSVSATDPSKRRDFEARYYLPPSSDSGHAAAARSFLDLPESYFAPTPVELQQAYAGQVKKREDLTDRPLLTKRLRDEEEARKSRQKAARWPQTRIRIRFSNRSQLEGVFPSTDKLVHLYEFVRLALREDVRDTQWFLYQSPPRTEYRKGAPEHRGKNLMALEFTPSSALYIKFEADESLNDPSRPPPLTPDLLSSAAPLPPPPSFDPRAPAPEAPEKTEEQKKREKEEKLKRLMGMGGGKGGSMGGGNKGSVVPGWMKKHKK